jgi:hypothetical protein
MTRRKLFAITAGVLLLFAAIDFWQRIFVPRHQQVRAASSFVPAAVPAPASSAQIRKDLSTWLPKLAPIGEASGQAAGDAQWGLQLLAVFEDQSGRFAVIRATPAAGGAVKIQRVLEGGDLYGYKVARIEPLRVKLEGKQGVQELQLFNPKSAPVVGAASQAGVVPSEPAARAPVAQPAPGAPANSGRTAPAPAAQPAQQAASGTPAAPAASKGPKAVQTQELKPGQAFELPESMRGLKVLDAPVPPPPPKNP